MRVIFRTTLVHSCYSPEVMPDLLKAAPKKCKCRKLITKEQAEEWVSHGEADWVIRYEGNKPVKTWNIVLLGRKTKTPRGQTLEKAHLERGVERREQLAEALWLSDEGQMAKDIEAAAMGGEQAELFELYHDLEMEERYHIFKGCGAQLRDLKKFSDTLGTVEGADGKCVSDVIVEQSNKLKLDAAVDDPFEGRPVLAQIGCDQRTVNGK